MYGHPPRSRHLRGTPVAQPPSHSPNPNIHRQDPSHHSQNPNFPLQSPNFPTQNSGVPPHHFPNRGYRSQRRSQNYEEALKRIERAVAKSRRDLHAAGESVSACKVSQDALLILQVDSWGSLGFQVQEVPSLHRLIVMEGKINAFIHCFVGARRITSLYDLEVAICKDEGIEQFEELEMGPLLRHQLVVHYFSVNSEVTCVYKITSEEIIYFLLLFKDTLKKKKYIEAEEFLDFIAMKREVVGREKLCVRIQSMGMHATFIREARASEYSTLKEFLKKCRKRTFDSTEKMHVDDFSSVQDNFGGKNTIVFSSISEDDREAHRSLDDDARPYLKGEADADVSRASSNFCNNESGQSVQRIKKSENLRCATSAPVKLSKKGRVNLDHSIDDLIADKYMRIFITMLKDACQGQTIGEVLERILQFYVFSAKQIRKAKTMFSSVPYAGLLIIAFTLL